MGLGLSSGAVRAVGPVQSMREQWVDAQMSSPVIPAQTVGDFLVQANGTTQGVDVSFKLSDTAGVKLVTLVRATVMDLKVATVLQTWAPKVSSYAWSDTDAILQQAGQAFYWVLLAPLNTNGVELEAGPQFILLNPSLLPPLTLSGVSASHAAAQNGAVLVTCNVSSIESGDSVKIYVTGYEGNAAAVAVAQAAKTPLQFTLEATGETVTIEAIAVSPGGAEAASGPTCTLVLNGAATVPAAIQGVLVTQIAAGNQVGWPASLEVGVTAYRLYRGQREAGFALASLLATVSATSAGTVLYLDTAGLTGDWEYYIVSVSGLGNSLPSPAANPQVLFSSSQLPPNTTANQLSTGIIDSFDAGLSATIRIYGAGGVGTGWTKRFGYGTITRPAGTVAGLAYGTVYYIMFVSASQTYLASTTYSDSLPDGYDWVGTMTTAPSAGGGGSATATAGAGINPTTGQLVSVYSTNNGYGYGSASVALTPSNGAQVTANCQYGQVVSYTVINPGSGFASNPTVAVTKTSDYTGGGGTATSTTGGSRYVLTS